MKWNWKKIVAAITGCVIFAAILIYSNDITKDNLQEDGNRYGNQEVILKMNSGELKGKEVEATSPNGTLFGADCTEGMHIIAIVSIAEGENVVTVYSQDRTWAIYGFLAVFMLIVCLIGGKKGIKAILSLIFTGVTILYLLFPLIYRGYSPFWSHC